MQLNYLVEKVYENIEISKDIYKLSIKGNFKAKPGQFYMIRGWDMQPLLPRPVSIYDIDDGKISFLYQVRGEGTQKLSKLKSEDNIKLLGPLGNGFDVERLGGKVAVVAGGIGIAPMLYTVKKLKNVQVDVYAGFREDIYSVEEIRKHVNNVYVTTEKGNEGIRGYIVDVFNPWEYNVVLCCGPEIMMEKVIKKCKEYSTPVYVSMENHMACGIGACLVCTCKTIDGNRRTCKDGPVFSGREVILNA